MNLKMMWLVYGMDIPWHIAVEWKKDLFHPVPKKCVLCGLEWRPDRNKEFIDVWGNIVQMSKHGGPRWYCKQLRLSAPTGYLEPHSRLICNRHANLWETVVNCFTNETVNLVQPKSALYYLLREIKDTIVYSFWFCYGLVKEGLYSIVKWMTRTEVLRSVRERKAVSH